MNAPLQSRAPAPLRLGCIIDTMLTGGAERLMVTFAEEALRRPNVRLTVFVLSDRKTPLSEELAALGVEIVALPEASLVSPGRFLRLLREMRARRIEFLHAHLTTATVVGANVAALLGAGFATTIHNVRSSVRRVSWVRGRLYRNALRRRDIRRIAVGQAVAEANVQDAGGQAFTVVPNAVPDSVVWRGNDRAATRAELGLADDHVALLAVGGLYAQKAYPDLIDAFALVSADRPLTRLLIAGAGVEKSYAEGLQAHVARLGLGDRVAFLGLRRDIPRLLAACDLFVSGSHWEGAPVSLLEAMANGLPCVVTDVGDNRLVLEGTGAETPPAQAPERLAAAMAAMIDDPARRAACGAAAQRRALEHYGVRGWVDLHLALYAEGMTRRDWFDAAVTDESLQCAS